MGERRYLGIRRSQFVLSGEYVKCAVCVLQRNIGGLTFYKRRINGRLPSNITDKGSNKMDDASKPCLPNLLTPCSQATAGLCAVFFRWDISVIFPVIVLNFTATVFSRLPIRTLWPNWLNFFRLFKTKFGLWPKKTQTVYTGLLRNF